MVQEGKMEFALRKNIILAKRLSKETSSNSITYSRLNFLPGTMENAIFAY